MVAQVLKCLSSSHVFTTLIRFGIYRIKPACYSKAKTFHMKKITLIAAVAGLSVGVAFGVFRPPDGRPRPPPFQAQPPPRHKPSRAQPPYPLKPLLSKSKSFHLAFLP